jgi:translocation protein SEC72
MEETFTLLPVRLDPQTKAISADPSSPELDTELAALNALHRSLLGVETPHGAPPPPVPVNPKRSAQVNKLKETGNNSFRKGQYPEAIRMYSLAIDMALQRPAWEPAQLVREEVSALYANRAQCHVTMQNWPEGAIDAQSSVEMKKIGNPKAWWRRGKCLFEMGRLEEAAAWVEEALEYEASEQDLVALRKEIEQALDKKAKQ